MKTNIAGIHPFNHKRLMRMAEYRELYAALDRLTLAIDQAGIQMEQSEWAQVVSEMVSALPYSDHCYQGHESGDDSTLYAHHVEFQDDGYLHIRYVCSKHGHSESWWAMDAPFMH